MKKVTQTYPISTVEEAVAALQSILPILKANSATGPGGTAYNVVSEVVDWFSNHNGPKSLEQINREIDHWNQTAGHPE